MWQNYFTKLLNVKYPIIQAPMAGGPTSTALVAAVSNAGGLGMIGAGYMTPVQIREQIRDVKQMTNHAFGINFFVPVKYSLDEKKLTAAKNFLEPIMEELSVVRPTVLPNYEQDLKVFYQQINVILEEKVPVCTFTFGIPSPEIITKLKENKITPIGTATTVQEAILNEQAGMEAVVVQGAEAGGHRGTFHGGAEQSLIGLMSFVPQAADCIRIPIIASGGIMDGRGVMAVKCLGASAVQMGTAFLVCEESGANQTHKNAIFNATEEQVVLTRSFSGKMARGIKNSFIEKMKEMRLSSLIIQYKMS